MKSRSVSSIACLTGALSTSCHSHEMSSRVVGHEVVDHKVSSVKMCRKSTCCRNGYLVKNKGIVTRTGL